MNSLSPENCARVLRSFAVLNKLDKRVLSRYSERIVDSEFKGFSGRDVAIILNSFVRLGFFDTSVFTSASSYLRNLEESEFISERHLGLIFNAFARSGIADVDLFDSLARRIEKQMPNLSSPSCGNIAHAFGKLGMKNETARALLSKIALRVTSSLKKQVSARELSNIMYSFGNLGFSDSEYLDPLLSLVKERINRFNSIEIAAVTTSLSKLSVSDKPLMASIRTLVEKNFTSFSVYEITAVLHAFSQLDVQIPKKLYSEIAPLVFASGECNSHTACIAFSAFARVGIVPPSSLMDKLALLIESENDPQFLVDAIFAIGRIGLVSERLSELLNCLVLKLGKKSLPHCPVNLNQIIFALNKIEKSRHPEIAPLYESVVDSAIKTVKDFDGRHISNILFALSRKDVTTSAENRLTGLLLKRLASVEEITPQLFGSCVEAAVRLGIDSSLLMPLESRFKFLVPEPSVDISIVEALSRAGRLTGKIADILLKRIDSNRISLDLIIRLLDSLENIDATNHIVKLTKQSAARASLKFIDTMSAQQLQSILKALGSLKDDIFPLNFVLTMEPSSNGSAVNRLSYAVCDWIESFPGDRIDFIFEQLEKAKDESAPESVREIFTDLLVSYIEKSRDFQVVSKSIPYLSPKHDSFLANRVMELLKDDPNPPHSLRHAPILLSIDDPNFRNQILNQYLPVWIRGECRE